jgi:hypothetical protein
VAIWQEKARLRQEFQPADKVLGQMPIMSKGTLFMTKALPGDVVVLSEISPPAEGE